MEVEKILEQKLKTKLEEYGYYEALAKNDYTRADNIFNSVIEDLMSEFDECFSTSEYTGWPDGRGGDILALYFEYNNKCYRAWIYDENTINLKEITKDELIERRKEVLGF